MAHNFLICFGKNQAENRRPCYIHFFQDQCHHYIEGEPWEVFASLVPFTLGTAPPFHSGHFSHRGEGGTFFFGTGVDLAWEGLDSLSSLTPSPNIIFNCILQELMYPLRIKLLVTIQCILKSTGVGNYLFDINLLKTLQLKIYFGITHFGTS